MPVRRSVRLRDTEVWQILTDTVPQSFCKPKVLFVCKEDSKGCTAQWGVMMRFLATLSAILDASKGQQLTMSTFTKQLGAWLTKEVGEWSHADVEASADGLRIMIRSLKSLKDDLENVFKKNQCLANYFCLSKGLLDLGIII